MPLINLLSLYYCTRIYIAITCQVEKGIFKKYFENLLSTVTTRYPSMSNWSMYGHKSMNTAWMYKDHNSMPLCKITLKPVIGSHPDRGGISWPWSTDRDTISRVMAKYVCLLNHNTNIKQTEQWEVWMPGLSVNPHHPPTINIFPRGRPQSQLSTR